MNLLADSMPGSRLAPFDVESMQDEFSGAFGGRKVDIETAEILGNRFRRDSIMPDLKVIYEAPETLVRSK